MQILLRSRSDFAAYVGGREWRDARLSHCPLHPGGGCSFRRHGSYGRTTPRGLRVARWYCPEGRRTFSLLPDFLCAKLPGLLSSIEAAVRSVSDYRSIEAAADALRQDGITLPSAVRWLRRRIRAVATRSAWCRQHDMGADCKSGDDIVARATPSRFPCPAASTFPPLPPFDPRHSRLPRFGAGILSSGTAAQGYICSG
jgi:hypothetical protein